jgi:hypothetical protein
MATCPYCGQYLGTNHTCRGTWRLRLRYWGTVLFGGLCGGAIAAVVLVVTFGSASPLALAAAVVLGGVVAFAYLRGEP